MILLLIAALLMTSAAAQTIPKSEPLMNDKGEVVGTATVSGGRVYFRDVDGKLLYTMEKTAQGPVMYDPNGKKVEFTTTTKESRH